MSSASKQSAVILLHGIGRSSKLMRKLEHTLAADGYQILNLDYPSRKHTLEDLSKWIYEKIKPYCDTDRPIHFVGHSMGGIIVRMIIRDHRPKNLGRVVMMGTPNHGSIVADFMQRFKFYAKWFGPAGTQIGTNPNGVHHDLPPADYECAIIAGDRSLDPWFSWFLYCGEPNDGKVSVKNTKLDGMSGFMVVHATHTFLPKNKKVIASVRKFLDTGSF